MTTILINPSSERVEHDVVTTVSQQVCYLQYSNLRFYSNRYEKLLVPWMFVII
jgi:hypothetical protein